MHNQSIFLSKNFIFILYSFLYLKVATEISAACIIIAHYLFAKYVDVKLRLVVLVTCIAATIANISFPKQVMHLGIRETRVYFLRRNILDASCAARRA